MLRLHGRDDIADGALQKRMHGQGLGVVEMTQLRVALVQVQHAPVFKPERHPIVSNPGNLGGSAVDTDPEALSPSRLCAPVIRTEPRTPRWPSLEPPRTRSDRRRGFSGCRNRVRQAPGALPQRLPSAARGVLLRTPRAGICFTRGRRRSLLASGVPARHVAYFWAGVRSAHRPLNDWLVSACKAATGRGSWSPGTARHCPVRRGICFRSRGAGAHRRRSGHRSRAPATMPRASLRCWSPPAFPAPLRAARSRRPC